MRFQCVQAKFDRRTHGVEVEDCGYVRVYSLDTPNGVQLVRLLAAAGTASDGWRMRAVAQALVPAWPLPFFDHDYSLLR